MTQDKPKLGPKMLRVRNGFLGKTHAFMPSEALNTAVGDYLGLMASIGLSGVLGPRLDPQTNEPVPAKVVKDQLDSAFQAISAELGRQGLPKSESFTDKVIEAYVQPRGQSF